MAILQIPITKAGKGMTIPFDTDWFTDGIPQDDGSVMPVPDEAYLAIVYEGAKHYLNQKMGKLAPASKEAEGSQARDKAVKEAMAQGQANLEALQKGEIRKAAGAKSKINGAVKTEAMRLARQLVKDAIKREGKVKVSLVPAREISKLAEEVLGGEYGPDLIKMAQANIENREKEASGLGIDVSGIAEDPKLRAKADKAASSKKKPGKESVTTKHRGEAHV